MTSPLDNIKGAAVSAPVSRKRHRSQQSRIDNTVRLIAEFRTREMTRRDVMALFTFSENGAGRYLREMLEGGIIEIARFDNPGARTPGHPVYVLTADDEAIAAFMAATSIQTGTKCATQKAKSDKRRTLHVMHDDAYFQVKMHRAPVAADPLALPGGFFKPAQSDDEPMPRAVAAPVARSSWPVPNSAAFVVPQ